jgi:RHS repeat-associated protein
VSHIHGPLLEENHYYGFGLTMAGISSKAMGKMENRYKFNEGTERTTDLDLQWDETDCRTYDPQIGRFLQIDPFSEISDHLSPFVYASNNPIIRNDPYGLKDSVVNGENVNTAPTLDEVVVYGKKPKPQNAQ